MKTRILSLVKCIFIFTLIFNPIFGQKGNGNITLTVNKISELKGVLKIGLYNSKESYDNGDTYKSVEVKVNNKTETVVFENIEFGEYGIKIYHDENGNGKLDKGLFGIPTEPYGFSNDASGFMGPASFEKAKFNHNSTNTTNTINL